MIQRRSKMLELPPDPALPPERQAEIANARRYLRWIRDERRKQ